MSSAGATALAGLLVQPQAAAGAAGASVQGQGVFGTVEGLDFAEALAGFMALAAAPETAKAEAAAQDKEIEEAVPDAVLAEAAATPLAASLLVRTTCATEPAPKSEIAPALQPAADPGLTLELAEQPSPLAPEAVEGEVAAARSPDLAETGAPDELPAAPSETAPPDATAASRRTPAESASPQAFAAVARHDVQGPAPGRPGPRSDPPGQIVAADVSQRAEAHLQAPGLNRPASEGEAPAPEQAAYAGPPLAAPVTAPPTANAAPKGSGADLAAVHAKLAELGVSTPVRGIPRAVERVLGHNSHAAASAVLVNLMSAEPASPPAQAPAPPLPAANAGPPVSAAPPSPDLPEAAVAAFQASVLPAPPRPVRAGQTDPAPVAQATELELEPETAETPAPLAGPPVKPAPDRIRALEAKLAEAPPVEPDLGASASTRSRDPEPVMAASGLSGPTAPAIDLPRFVPTPSAHTINQLAAQIAAKSDGRASRFDVQLEPEGLGKVDVRIEISARGEVAAAMTFDNPQAAAELRGRAGELARALEQAGFDLAKNGLSFDLGGSGPGGGRLAEQGSHEQGAWRGRAFVDVAEAADPQAPAHPYLRAVDSGRIDVTV